MSVEQLDREMKVATNGSQFLVYARLVSGCPTVVFLTGGSHLARVAYGHPGSDPTDFLDHHLAVEQYGLIAISYPGSHPLFDRPDPFMTVSSWAEGVADSLATMAGSGPLLIAGWSMAGKGILRLSQAMAARNLAVTGFVSLSAWPPWSVLSPRRPSGEPVRPDGLWDYAPYAASTWREIEEVNELAESVIISATDYARFYRNDGPIMLRAERDRIDDSGTFDDIAAALGDSAAFAFDQAPLCATISPTSPRDAEHALAGPAIWSSIALLGLLRHHLAGVDISRLAADDWAWLRDCAAQWAAAMNRTVAGGHYFFLGSAGARATALALIDLSDRMSAILSKLRLARERAA